MAIDLSSRGAVVTGAGRGIGRATALELARLGAGVVVNDIGTSTGGAGSDVGPAREVAQEIQAAGGRAAFNTDSVTDFAGAERMVALCEEAFGSADILVNNAGLSAGKPIWEMEPELFREVCFSHVLGTFNCTRASAPKMRERGHGRIVNLVSRAGLLGMPGNAAYGAGKGGIFGLTNVVSRDLAPFGITVNAVNPSATDTRMVSEAIERIRAQGDESSAKTADGLARALQRPEDVAVLIAALASDEAAGINGEIFYVAGSEVGLFQPLTVTQSRTAPESWSADALIEALADLELHTMDGPYG